MSTSKQKTYIINKVVALLVVMLCSAISTKAQDVIVNPEISYAGTPRTCIV